MKRIAFAALICVLGVGCEQTPQEQAAEALQQEGIFPQHYAEALQKATREGNVGLMPPTHLCGSTSASENGGLR